MKYIQKFEKCDMINLTKQKIKKNTRTSVFFCKSRCKIIKMSS